MQVFISYASPDREFARELASRLSEAGFEVLDPEHDVSGGENIPLKIGRALEQSDAMIVLLSPEAVRTPSLRREIDYALGSPNFEQRLISVLMRPTEDIPWILRKLPMVAAGKDLARVSNRIIQQLQQHAKAE
ncbi:MAG TPA: toll/interleukin-1 receptor domain-containing protein [Gemmataceae bacterium]|jgi:hypothetical protein|nr:toll/interleukin-1 receptor domain-containing protein [Gemmataceae bacterium]